MNESLSTSELNETAGFLGGLIRQGRLVWRLLKDGRVPGWVKMIPFASLLYFFIPLDLIPEMALPGLGELDDIAVFLLAFKLFVDLSPAGVVREHLNDLSGMANHARHATESSAPATVDGDYQILEESRPE